MKGLGSSDRSLIISKAFLTVFIIFKIYNIYLTLSNIIFEGGRNKEVTYGNTRHKSCNPDKGVTCQFLQRLTGHPAWLIRQHRCRDSGLPESGGRLQIESGYMRKLFN